MFVKWFHHLFNPHCQECKDEARENRICESCEVLKSELTSARYEREQLLKVITDLHKPPVIQQVIGEAPKPLNTGTIPWRVRQQMLEAESRQAAAILRNKQAETAESVKTTEQLENELLGEDNAVRSSDEQVENKQTA